MPGYGSGAAVILVISVALSGCSTATESTPATPESDEPAAVFADPHPSDLHGTILDPPLLRPTQTLRDTSGRPFSLADRPQGELTLLFFGYTHCPDVCPTTMADLAGARSQAPAELRDSIRVVFVTEDPRRDTPHLLRRWLDGFDPSFVGLSGGNSETKPMLKGLYSPETKRLAHPEKRIKHPDSGGPQHHHGDYGIEHTGIVYAFGPGDTTVIYSGGTKPSQYAADFIRLLDGASPDS